MSQRKSNVQTDPVRRSLGGQVVAKDVTCPNCGHGYATESRWQMRCPNCGYMWIDRSGRTLLDKLRDVRLEVIASIVGVAGIIAALSFLAVWVGWLFAEAADLRGWERTYGLALFFIGCIVSLGLLAYWFRNGRNSS